MKIKAILLSALAGFSIAAAQATDTIAMVNNDPISVTQFQQRVRFARWTTAQQLVQVMQSHGEKGLTDPESPYHAQYLLLSDKQGLGQQVLDSLITVKLVQQEATKRGITVSDEEIQQQVQAFFGYVPDATPQPTLPGQPPPPDATAVAQAFIEHRDNYFGIAGDTARMTQADVLMTFVEQALQIKVYEAVTENAPKDAEQIQVRHILADTEENATVWLAELNNGADFATIAQTKSLDSTSAAFGGDLGWAPKDTYFTELEAAIWNTPIGTIVGPIKTEFGYHILRIEGRAVRPLSDIHLASAREKLYQQWLQQARDSASIQIVENWQAFVPDEPTVQQLGLP